MTEEKYTAQQLKENPATAMVAGFFLFHDRKEERLWNSFGYCLATGG